MVTTVRAGTRESFATVNGTNPATPKVIRRDLARGSYLRSSDVDTRRRVAVLGSRLARSLFDGVDPIGRTVAVGGVRFRVIGIFAELPTSLGADRNNEIHVPITTAQRLFGSPRVDALAVQAPTSDDIPRVRMRALGRAAGPASRR